MRDKCALCPMIAKYEFSGRNLCSECVSREAAKVEAPAEVPHPKPPRNKGKSLSEIEAKDNYSGEASPYWDDLAKQHWQTDNNQLSECPEANPDVLPESASLYAYTPSEAEQLRAEVLREVIEGLTDRQREAITLCESPDYTEEKAAAKLGMTRFAFRTIIDRIQKLIETKIEQRQRNSQWQK